MKRFPGYVTKGENSSTHIATSEVLSTCELPELVAGCGTSLDAIPNTLGFQRSAASLYKLPTVRRLPDRDAEGMASP